MRRKRMDYPAENPGTRSQRLVPKVLPGNALLARVLPRLAVREAEPRGSGIPGGAWEPVAAHGVCLLLLHFPKQPGPGVSPVAISSCDADAERRGCLLLRQADEIPQLHQLGLPRMGRGQPVERRVQLEQ